MRHGPHVRPPACSIALVLVIAVACADPAPPRAVDGVPATLEIRCDGETTEILTPTVQARSDGVHMLIRNTSDVRVFTEWGSGGEGADPGDTLVVRPILPGSARFRCLEETDDLDPGIPGGWERYEVLPPDGWVSPDLDCAGGMYSGVGDFVPGARGVVDPLADAREQFRLDGTAVEAGYRTDEERTFINVTDDGAKESLTYTSDGHDGWLRSGSSGCSD